MYNLRRFESRRVSFANIVNQATLRYNSSLLNAPDPKSFPEFLKTVESRWKMKLMRRFDRERYVGSKEELACEKPPRYILSMFPYPSGRLHLGHVRIYTSADLLTRFSRLMSKNQRNSQDYNHVINPMGFDSFGLPAENAAKERGLHPASWTNSNIRTMKTQMDDLALQFDWREATSNPSYYKWTQELFLKLMDAGLVYKSFAAVNWDPVDNTVLADEQVDENGRSWRSGALVEKRNYRQWFIKVNSLIKEVYDAEEVDAETWGDILAIQRSWIGRPSGWLFYLPIGNSSDILPIFTTTPELFMQPDTQLLISRDHWLEKIYRISNEGHIDNIFTGTKLRITLTDDIDAIPPNNYATLLQSNYSEKSHDLIAREQVLLTAKLNNLGGYYTSDRYRDWLISRQRFWGTPIPVARCQSCGFIGVPKEDLPVKLPSVQNLSEKLETSDKFEDDIATPIKDVAPLDWINVDCPSCGAKSKRECETFDTLFDSSWYFLRYATGPSSEEAFDPRRVQPVWCYIGGKEHASMHLFYARFITHFLHSINELKFKEPFKKLLVQGVVKSRTYKHEGRYLSQTEVDEISDKSKLSVEYEKMSKSKGNGVDPQDLIDKYGADATRFCLMDYANPRSERLWRSEQEEMKDVLNFLRKVTLTITDYIQASTALVGKGNEQTNIKIKELSEPELEEKKLSLVDMRNKCSIDATFHIQETNQFRQYIVALHQLLSALRTNSKTSLVYTREYAEALASLVIMLNPLTPHLSEELWLHFSKCMINPLKDSSTYNIALQASDQSWPIPDDDYPLLIKVKSEQADEYVDRIPISRKELNDMSKDELAMLVQTRFSSVGDKCLVRDVKKYKDLTVIVTADIDSVNQRVAEKRKRKKEIKNASQ